MKTEENECREEIAKKNALEDPDNVDRFEIQKRKYNQMLSPPRRVNKEEADSDDRIEIVHITRENKKKKLELAVEEVSKAFRVLRIESDDLPPTHLTNISPVIAKSLDLFIIMIKNQ